MKSLSKIRLHIRTTLAIFLGIFVIGITFADTIIPGDIDTSLQVIKRLLITVDGSPMGNPIADLNTGGNIIFYPHIYDENGNQYLTEESDPKFSSSSAAGISSSQISHWNTAYTRGNHALMGYLTGETDPLWFLEKPNYYTKTEVDNLLSSTVGGLKYKGVWDYSTGALPADVSLGYFFKISTEGNYNGLHLSTGDMIIANSTVSGETSSDNWDVISNTVSETDPVFSSSVVASIGSLDINHWNDAYSRGNHVLMGYLTGELDPLWILEKGNYYTKEQINSKSYLTQELDPQWNGDKSNYYTKGDITSKGFLTSENDPQRTTEKTNYYTRTAIDQKFDELSGSLGGIINELDPVWSLASGDYYTKSAIDAKGFLTGYSEADPLWTASSGDYYTKSAIDAKNFLTSFSELDPLFSASAAAGITSTDISHWDTSYARGNHALMGYLTGFSELDPQWNTDKSSYYTKSAIDDKGFLTGYSETDPLWTASSGDYYTKSAIDAKNFLTSFSELDPLFSASVAAGITSTDISHWDTSYARGNHALMGYLTGFTELDPLWTASSGDYYTKSAIDDKGFLTGQVWNQSTTTLNYMSGNVGIGVSNPTQALEVASTSATQGLFRQSGAAAGGIQLGNIVGQNAKFLFSAGGDNTLSIVTNYNGGANNTILFSPGGTETIRFKQGGNVGIGTTTPTSNLQVTQASTGPGKVTNLAGGTIITGFLTQFLNTFKVGDTITIGSQTVTISAITSNTSITVSTPITNANTNVAYTLVGGDRFAVKGNGNVGIGTTNPSEKFQVNQSTVLPGTVSNTAGGSTVTGIGTQFTTTLKAGDTIIVNGETKSIYSITNDTSLATASVFTNANTNATYTTSGAVRFAVKNNGMVGFGTATPTKDVEIFNASPNTNTTLRFTSYGSTSYSTDFVNTAGTYGPIFGINLNIASHMPSSFTIGMASVPKLYILNNHNVGIGANSPTALFQVEQSTTINGGSVSNLAGGTIITGYLTQFLNTFKVGDTITFGGQTSTISTIASDTSMTVSSPITNANSYAGYTVVGGSRFVVKGNGRVGIGTSTPAANLEVYSPNPSLTSTIRNTAYSSSYAVEYITDAYGFGKSAIDIKFGNSVYPIYQYIRFGGIDKYAFGNGGWFGIGTGTPTGLLDVVQPTNGVGTIANAANGTLITGSYTQFTNTLKVGDTITVGGQTVSVASIASNTSMTVSPAITLSNSSAAFTVVGGQRFVVKGNGNVGIGVSNPGQKLEVNGAIRITDAFSAVYAPRISSWGASDLKVTSDNNIVVYGGAGYGIALGGSFVPTAKVHLAAGSATTKTAPLKFTSGPLLTMPEAGTLEYLSNMFYIRGTDGLNINGNVGIGTTTSTSKLGVAGDIELPSTGGVLLGAPDTEGTRKITTNAGALSFQVYKSGARVEKSTIAP